MSDFNAKMHQIQFLLGSAPGPAWGAYSTPPGPIAGFEGPNSKAGEGRRGKWQTNRQTCRWLIYVSRHFGSSGHRSTARISDGRTDGRTASQTDRQTDL